MTQGNWEICALLKVGQCFFPPQVLDKKRHTGAPGEHKGLWCMKHMILRANILNTITNIISNCISHLKVTCRAFYTRLWKSMIILFFKVPYGPNIFLPHKYLLRAFLTNVVRTEFLKYIFKHSTIKNFHSANKALINSNIWCKI